MFESADIVIIGGGIAGSSIFYELTKAKLGKVVLVESGEISGRTTGESGGFIRKFVGDPYIGKLTRESFDYYQNFDSEVGGSCGFRKTGFAALVSLDFASKAENGIKALQNSGYTISLSSLPPTTALRESIKSDSDIAFVYEPNAGNVDTKLTSNSWVSAGIRNGGKVFENTQVEEIIVANRKVAGVRTTRGIIETGTVVLAAGAWSNQLLTKTASNETTSVTRRGEACPAREATKDPSYVSAKSFQYNIYEDAAKHLDTAFLDAVSGIYLFPLLSGNAIAGFLRDDKLVTDFQFNHMVDSDASQRLDSALKTRFTWINNKKMSIAKRSYDAFTEDERGIIKRSDDIAGLILATGMSGGGIKIAPAFAKEVVKIIGEN